MVRTRVGYTGGTKKNPTYHDLEGHSEAVQVDYDPAVISYETLLAIFWDSHDPASPAFSPQYMSAVFTHNDQQKRLAEESRGAKRQGSRGRSKPRSVPPGSLPGRKTITRSTSSVRTTTSFGS